MGILEEAAGAFAGVEAAKKLDPNAGILTEAVAAIGGAEGLKAIAEHFEEKKENDSGNQNQG